MAISEVHVALEFDQNTRIPALQDVMHMLWPLKVAVQSVGKTLWLQAWHGPASASAGTSCTQLPPSGGTTAT